MPFSLTTLYGCCGVVVLIALSRQYCMLKEGCVSWKKTFGKFSENIEATYSLKTTYSLEWMKFNYSSFVFNNNSISTCVR